MCVVENIWPAGIPRAVSPHVSSCRPIKRHSHQQTSEFSHVGWRRLYDDSGSGAWASCCSWVYCTAPGRQIELSHYYRMIVQHNRFRRVARNTHTSCSEHRRKLTGIAKRVQRFCIYEKDAGPKWRKYSINVQRGDKIMSL